MTSVIQQRFQMCQFRKNQKASIGYEKSVETIALFQCFCVKLLHNLFIISKTLR